MALISLPGSNRIKVPGITSDPNPHITLIYLGDNLDALDLIKVIKIVDEVCSNTPKFNVKVDYTSMFSKGKYGYPIICPIQSLDIHVLRDKIIQSLTRNRIHFENTFMTFRPHQTVCFSKEVIRSYPLEVSWEINKVNIWPENKGNKGEIPVLLSGSGFSKHIKKNTHIFVQRI